LAYIKHLSGKLSKLGVENGVIKAVNADNVKTLTDVKTAFAKSLTTLKSEHLKDLGALKEVAQGNADLSAKVAEREAEVKAGSLVDSDILTEGERDAIMSLTKKQSR
jgi:hypothetical protein